MASPIAQGMKVSLQQLQKLPWLEAGLAFLTLLFLFPFPYFVFPNLDSSWQGRSGRGLLQTMAIRKGDIIFTGGPLSFLYSPTSNGYFPFLQVFAEALVLFLALFFLFSTIRSQPNWVHATLFIVLFCAAAAGKDGIYLSSLAAVSFRLIRGDLKLYGVVALYGFVAVLSLMKFSFALMGFGCTALLSLFFLWQGNYKTAGTLFGVYLLTLLLLWMAAGQSSQICLLIGAIPSAWPQATSGPCRDTNPSVFSCLFFSYSFWQGSPFWPGRFCAGRNRSIGESSGFRP